MKTIVAMSGLTVSSLAAGNLSLGGPLIVLTPSGIAAFNGHSSAYLDRSVA